MEICCASSGICCCRQCLLSVRAYPPAGMLRKNNRAIDSAAAMQEQSYSSTNPENMLGARTGTCCNSWSFCSKGQIQHAILTPPLNYFTDIGEYLATSRAICCCWRRLMSCRACLRCSAWASRCTFCSASHSSIASSTHCLPNSHISEWIMHTRCTPCCAACTHSLLPHAALLLCRTFLHGLDALPANQPGLSMDNAHRYALCVLLCNILRCLGLHLQGWFNSLHGLPKPLPIKQPCTSRVDCACNYALCSMFAMQHAHLLRCRICTCYSKCPSTSCAVMVHPSYAAYSYSV